MKGDNKSGKYGEIYASKYLAGKGYEILCTNYKTSFCEIDIIARDTDGTLCFVEVKTRKNKLYGSGSDFIFPSKIKKMILGARSYMAHKNADTPVRFDIIEIYGNMMLTGFVVDEINHIQNAFDA